METLKTVLVANRGEIACRLIRAARDLGIKTISIYTEPDSTSQHVRLAEEAYLLEGEARSAYLDGDQIISIAKAHEAQGILPGYGFLSENTEFARSVAAAGLVFAGPSPEAIESFGLKHTARDLAVKAGVPIVPGSQGLVDNEETAVSTAAELGFPVMLKATAGGGGMGLLTCANEKEVRDNFRTVQSRGQALFKHAGVFIERYFPDSHHIEVQVFGNGLGKVISIGERECSIQRRHQKVIEECPSPLVERRYPELRTKLTSCAIKLAESINYGSAGTVEYLVDDHSGDFFFLEMNTRLQVEHGITEMCYDVDLVQLMLLQADRQLSGRGGIDESQLAELQSRCTVPKGHAIESRVYAENPARNYSPSPGLLQGVSWHEQPGTRIDTWVRTGITIGPEYDPLIAKVMYYAQTRDQAIMGMEEVLGKSNICGPPVNLDFLIAVIQTAEFKQGNTLTRFLGSFKFTLPAIDILAGGSYTLIQDFPGRPTLGRGFGHAGPMDPIAFRAANILVGNPHNTEGLEITLTGPDLSFLGDAVIALCGPDIPATLDGEPIPLWARVHVRSGQRLRIGKMEAFCRAYLAIYGGFPSVAQWFGSKSTNPMAQIGGYQGRPLRSGDLLRIADATQLPTTQVTPIPENILPKYSRTWEVQGMAGPYADGYLTETDLEMIYAQEWEISHNAARGGIRLIGPRPQFSRKDGGDGGSHPSNVIEYGYPIGGLNWTGDEPVIFPLDCPDFGGYICNITVIRADFWKLGQLRAGDKVKFRRVGLEYALDLRRRHESWLESLASAVQAGSWEGVKHFDSSSLGSEVSGQGLDVLRFDEETTSNPRTTYRSGGEDYLLVDYGSGSFDLNLKCRGVMLKRALESATGKVSADRGQGGVIYNLVGCGNSLAVHYDGLRVSRDEVMTRLLEIEKSLGSMKSAKIPNRHFRLPVTFTHKKANEAMERYMANQRSIASYLPDPFKFVAEANGMTLDDLKNMYLQLTAVVICVGFYMALPLGLPADPRHRIKAPKMNPSRTFTPEGTLSWGGTSLAIYTVDSPGGYMLTGMTMPGVDIFGYKAGFSPEKPWLFEDLDTFVLYEVTEEEYDAKMAQFKAGDYQWEVTESEFDLEEHNKLLGKVSEEAKQLKAKREAFLEKMAEYEKETLDQWIESKKAGQVNEDEVQEMLNQPGIDVVEAPVNANVWKIQVKEGDTVKEGQVLAILEAMKMEINVAADPQMDGAVVTNVLAQPGDGIAAGKPLMLVKHPDGSTDS